MLQRRLQLGKCGTLQREQALFFLSSYVQRRVRRPYLVYGDGYLLYCRCYPSLGLLTFLVIVAPKQGPYTSKYQLRDRRIAPSFGLRRIKITRDRHRRHPGQSSRGNIVTLSPQPVTRLRNLHV